MADKDNYGHARGAWDGKSVPAIKSLFDKLVAASQGLEPHQGIRFESSQGGPNPEAPDFADFAAGLKEGAKAAAAGGSMSHGSGGFDLPALHDGLKFENSQGGPNPPAPYELGVPQLPDWQPGGGSDSWATKAPNPEAEAKYAARMGFDSKPIATIPSLELAPEVPWQSTVKDNQPGWERGLRTATDPLRAQNIWQIPYRVAEKVNEVTGLNDLGAGMGAVLKDAANQFTMTVPEYRAQRTKVNQPAPTGKQSLEAMQPLLAAIAPGESGGRWDAQNPGSSAGGKYQILDQTWFETIAKHGKEMGLPNVQASMYKGKDGKWKFHSTETELLAKQAKMNPVTGELGALYTARTYHAK